jgi:hypothetical protein
MAKIYVGCKAGEPRQVFKSVILPTFETHGETFNAAIGPFRTMRGARFMAEHGAGNPHCCTVGQAERLGEKYAPAAGSVISKGTRAKVACQCTHPETGKTGDWLFIGESHQQSGAAISPVFGDLVQLFEWTRANGWRGIGFDYYFDGI